MFVWGRNNNHLFRQNHKKTYSLPQKVPINRSILKCAPGFDFILLLEKRPGPLICYYQSAFYQINHFGTNVVDVATTDNIIVVITVDGSGWIMQFNAQKIIEGQINPNKISIKQKSVAVWMNYGDIFIKTESQSVFYIKRNQWYQTKTYTDPVKISGFKRQQIKEIAPGINQNYFLTSQGKLYVSSKKQAQKVQLAKTSINFQKISAADYFLGIGDNGRLYIWGKYNQNNYETPTEFGKLAQTFESIHLSSQNGFAISVNGQGWIWGKNANGQLGISDYQPRAKPFPLITMDKYKIKNIFLGQNFTVCTVDKNQTQMTKPKKQKIKRQVSLQKSQGKSIRNKTNQYQQQPSNLSQKSKSKSKHKYCQGYHKDMNNKNNKLFVNQFSSLNIRDKQISQVSKNEKLKFVATEVIRKSPIKMNKAKTREDVSQKSFDRKINRSKSPVSNISRSKSPLSSKSPYVQKLRYKDNSNNKKQTKEGKSQSPYKTQSLMIKISELQTKNAQLVKNVESLKKTSSIRIRDLQEQNNKLKKIITMKQSLVEDVTQKIKLLQQAIEEHERTLTARDHMMEQYQKRQKEYQIHIDELEKNIETLIKAQSSLQPRQQENYNEMYKALKVEYFKEKDYFMQKMTEYQETLRNERIHYKQKIKNLEEQINTYRSSQNQELQQMNSRIKESKILAQRKNEKLNRQNPKTMKPIDQNGIKMDFIISRIEDSKVRIAKSATKLYQMIEDK